MGYESKRKKSIMVQAAKKIPYADILFLSIVGIMFGIMICFPLWAHAEITYTRTPNTFYAGTSAVVHVHSSDTETDYGASNCYPDGVVLVSFQVEVQDIGRGPQTLQYLLEPSPVEDPIPSDVEFNLPPNTLIDHVFYSDCYGTLHDLEGLTPSYDINGNYFNETLFSTYPISSAATSTPGTVNQDELLFVIGVCLFIASYGFWTNLLSIGKGSFDV